MIKSGFSNLLRQLRLLYLADKIQFYLHKIKNNKANSEFRKNNPDVKLPPDYLIYESFQLDYEEYYSGSIETAEWLKGLIEKHIELKNKRILDWGCGPGRIIRHLPRIINNSCEFYGTDYNADSIKWCSANLPGIEFNKNNLEAKLPYKDNFFDAIYGLSIFTHLSEEMHYAWYNELYRVLNKGGIMFLTTQGDNSKVKLTEEELAIYEKGNLVIRGNVKEGHRTYSAFQPTVFMKKLFKDVEILEHIVREPQGSWAPQDIWIVKK